MLKHLGKGEPVGRHGRAVQSIRTPGIKRMHP